MKQISIYLALVIAGVLVGYLLFGTGSSYPDADSHTHESVATEIWTCSMHPQIRQPEPGDCPICGMDLIPLTDQDSEATGPETFQMTEAAVQLANIQTSIVGPVDPGMKKDLVLNGTITADETTMASIVTHVPGRIEKLYVSFTGEEVSQHQPIADIYAPDLITAQQELLQAAEMASDHPELLAAARRKLGYWKINPDTITRIIETGELKEIFTISAPFEGVVMRRKVSVGDYLKTGEALLEVQNLGTLWVEFDAYEHQLPQLHIGSRITFETPAVPGQLFKARVNFIDPVIDPQSRTASVRAEINNRGNQLKPSMFVRGNIHVPTSASNQLAVPRSAVLWTGEKSVVYVQDKETSTPTFQYREVALKERQGDYYLVSAGLETGETVVTHGTFMLDASAQLNNKASMMNREVTVKGQDGGIRIPDYQDATPPEFRQQLLQIVTSYLDLKNALVATDPQQAKHAASTLADRLPEINMNLLEGAAHMYWMERQENLLAHTNAIISTNEIETQRAQFEHLSGELILAVKAFGIAGDKLYIQHCPMASNNQGADWISQDSFIANPYFGDQMLTCGLVTSIITSEEKNAQ